MIKRCALISFLVLVLVSGAAFGQNFPGSDMMNALGGFGGTTGQDGIDGIDPADTTGQDGQQTSDRERKVKKYRYADSIQVYKIINFRGDTTFVDTSLTIQKVYKFSQRRKDDFGLMRYPNIGEGYTPLVYDQKAGLFPEFGFRSRSYFYRDVEDINYYDVRTPWSEIMYYTVFLGPERGQVLDFNFTVNLSQFANISVGYRGTRTTGAYPYIKSTHGELVVTSNIHSRSYKYTLKTHVTYQFLTNTENGGITDEGLEYFRIGDQDFRFRASMPTNLSTTGSEVVNRLSGARFYLEHKYDLFNSSHKFPNRFRISLINELMWEQKNYKYKDPAFTSSSSGAGKMSVDYYGTYVLNNPLALDSTRYSMMRANVAVGVNFPLVNIYAQGGVGITHTKHIFPSDKVVEGKLFNGIDEGNTYTFSASGRWNPIKYFGADAQFSYNFSGLYSDARVFGFGAFTRLNEKYELKGSYTNYSYYPPITTTSYQSNFAKFNWKRDFDRIERNDLKVNLVTRYIDAGVSFVNINNYVYYDLDRLPQQWDQSINIIGINAGKTYQVFRNVGFDFSLLLQKVTGGENILALPEIVGRASLYYSNFLFRRAAFLMVGATVNYYSEFAAPFYDPLVSDYNIQDGTRKIGGYPFVDLFLSVKVRRTRIFFKYENINGYLGDYNYWSGPNQPAQDANVKFGLVWDFFN